MHTHSWTTNQQIHLFVHTGINATYHYIKYIMQTCSAGLLCEVQTAHTSTASDFQAPLHSPCIGWSSPMNDLGQLNRHANNHPTVGCIARNSTVVWHGSKDSKNTFTRKPLLLPLPKAHRCQPSYSPKWDKCAEKAGHWLKKQDKIFFTVSGMLERSMDWTSITHGIHQLNTMCRKTVLHW